jgi:PBSX family phage terminase large subunit
MFKSFSEKQKMFVKDVKQNNLSRINILQGSVRSGKTYVSLIAWLMLIVKYPQDSQFLMVGKTITSLKRNCLVLLESLCKRGTFSFSLSKKEAVLYGRKIYLEGVNDARAEQKIRGMTLQAAYCDEITLFTQDFFSMLLSRLSLPNAKLLGTTNPETPSHWLMKKYISRKNELNLKIWDFRLDDNDAVPPEIIQDMKREYTGVFYDRFILGKWVAAEGLIYPKFAENAKNHIIDKINIHELQSVHIGIDYGASKSRNAFVAIGFTSGFNKLIVLKESTSTGVNSPEMLYGKFLSFYEQVKAQYGYVSSCWADWGGLGQVLTKGLQTYFMQRQIPLKIKDCKKYRIIERINIVSRLIGAGKFEVHKDCPELIESLSNAVWEEDKDDIRLDDGTVNIDVLDAMEYALSNYIPSINNAFNLREKALSLPACLSGRQVI